MRTEIDSAVITRAVAITASGPLVDDEWERAAETIHEIFDAEPGWA